MKHVILHVGVHRAGSSTIQSVLDEHRAELACGGVGVITRAELERDRALRQLAAAHRSSLRGLAAAWTLARAEHEILIISEENLLGRMPEPGARALYPDHARLLRALVTLARLFRVSVRVVLRRQDRWLESVYAFRVWHGVSESFSEFMSGWRATDLSWLPLVRRLAAARLHSARVALLETAFAAGTEVCVAEFLGLGGEPGWQRPIVSENVGLRGPMLNVVRYYNRMLPGRPPSRAYQLRKVLARFARRPGRPLPRPDELRYKLAVAHFDAESSLARAAVAFAAREPLAELEAPERRALLARVAADNRELLRSPLLEAPGDAWADP